MMKKQPTEDDLLRAILQVKPIVAEAVAIHCGVADFGVANEQSSSTVLRETVWASPVSTQ